jgi:DNA-nicking Smr family endonuclease
VVRRPLKQRPLGSLAKLKPRVAAPATLVEMPAPEASFGDVMQRAGTVPLAPAAKRVVPPSPPPAPTGPRRGAAEGPRFEIDQQDGWIRGQRTELSPAQRRRLRGAPGSTLDLHGHDVPSARRALADFFALERARGCERALVIVGKGRHTAGGVGVLRAEIATWLSEPPLSAQVLAFATAPPNLGGTGGVLVLLAPGSRQKKP